MQALQRGDLLLRKLRSTKFALAPPSAKPQPAGLGLMQAKEKIDPGAFANFQACDNSNPTFMRLTATSNAFAAEWKSRCEQFARQGSVRWSSTPRLAHVARVLTHPATSLRRD